VSESKVLLNLMPTAIKSDKIDLSSEKETEELASTFLKKIKPGCFIFLYGEIGVGKTTFIRYLINQFQKLNKLEITEVTSPTFNLLNEYQINDFKINHYDLFRLKSTEEIKNLDLFEDNKNTITLVEWPQTIKEKPKNLIELVFEYGKDHKTRSVQIKGL
jgi:tRNA threonylcarbamoyladenosine biosynthesis protein TsaE